ncbi:MAG: hypothetical protein Q9169_005302 [Polycauliona sp. 2 TL-2023]
MGLHELPNEITISILNHLPKRRLKRIRLVSQKLAVLAAPILLDVLYISPRSKDTEVFDAITKHPVLSAGIRNIVYDSAKILQYSFEDYYNALQVQVQAAEYKTYEMSNDAVRELMKIMKPSANNFTSKLEGFRNFRDQSVWMETYRQYSLVAQARGTNHDGSWFAGVCDGLRKLGPIRSVTIRNTWDMVYDDDTWSESSDGSLDTREVLLTGVEDDDQCMDNTEDQWEDCSSNDELSETMLPDHAGLRSDGTRLVGSPLARAWPPTWLNPPYMTEHFFNRENVCGVSHDEWYRLHREFALTIQLLESAKIQPLAFRVTGNTDESELLSANALECLDTKKASEDPFLSLASNLKELNLSLAEWTASRRIPDLRLLRAFIQRAVSLVSLSLVLSTGSGYDVSGDDSTGEDEDMAVYEFTNIFPTLAKLELSKLSQLRFFGLRISYRDLVGLLFLKLPSLEMVWLSQIDLIKGGKWENIVEGLRHLSHIKYCCLESPLTYALRDTYLDNSLLGANIFLLANSRYIKYGGRHPALKKDEPDSASLKYLESLNQEFNKVRKALGVPA